MTGVATRGATPAAPTRGGNPRRTGRPRRARAPRRRLGTLTLVVLVALVTLLPFVAMLLVALSPPGGRTLPDVLWPDRLSMDNFVTALRGASLARWAVNSLVYSAVSTALVLILDFLTVSAVHGIDTYWGMVVPTLANVQSVFLMRQYISGLPDELFEAARIDGASEWRIFTRIVLPLARPGMAAIGVFVFIWHWNDFLWPLLVAQSDDMRTMTVGLASLRSDQMLPQQQLAAATITVLPCLLVFGLFQRYVADNVATAGIKG